ncbi:MAG TPA: Crp/Fnr family transcriptional regulator [Phenylobacterium sp.]
MSDPLYLKLAALGRLTEDDLRALRAQFTTTRDVAAGIDIVREGERPSTVVLLLKGFACRYKALPDGRRQILSFHIPGDILDLHGLLFGDMDHSVGAIQPCRVSMAPHDTMRELLERRPELSRVLWRDTLVDSAVFREWMVGMGRRHALERIAHLLCEVYARCEAAGLAKLGQCDLPLTQAELADSLGLSVVHVNRVLQQLRATGFITLRRGILRIHDWEGLKGAGGFHGGYLHLPASSQVA